MSDALHGLYRERLARGTWRDAPRPVLINNWEATYFDFDEDEAARDRDLGARPRRRAVRARRRLVRRARLRTTRRSATGSSTGASCPTGSTGSPPGSRRSGSGFGLWIEPEMVSRAEPPVRGAPGLGRSASPAGRGPRAASSSSSTCRGPRSSTTSSASLSEVLGERADLVRQVGHEPDHHRAVQPGPPGRPAGRVLPSLRARRLRPVRAADRAPSRTSCSSRAPAAAAGSIPGMLAFAPQAWTSDDTDAVERLRIQWGTSLAYPLSSMGAHVVGGPEPPDRPDHAARDARRGRVLRRRSATSSTRPR